MLDNIATPHLMANGLKAFPGLNDKAFNNFILSNLTQNLVNKNGGGYKGQNGGSGLFNFDNLGANLGNALGHNMALGNMALGNMALGNFPTDFGIGVDPAQGRSMISNNMGDAFGSSMPSSLSSLST